MPLYDFKCQVCGTEQSNRFVPMGTNEWPCSKCAGMAQRSGVSRSRAHSFQPFWHQNMAPDPVWIESKPEAKRLAKKHKVYLPGVLD